jgi:hypothetical protein
VRRHPSRTAPNQPPILVFTHAMLIPVPCVQAVAAWAQAVRSEVEDDGVDVEDASEEASGQGRSVPAIEAVKAKLDLSFVSTDDIYNVRSSLPMRPTCLCRQLQLPALCSVPICSMA